jgi:PAS domain-containing protein
LTILETNAKFEHLMGLQPEAFLNGKTFRELIPIMDDGWLRMLCRVAVSGELIRFQMDRQFESRGHQTTGPASRHLGSGRWFAPRALTFGFCFLKKGDQR